MIITRKNKKQFYAKRDFDKINFVILLYFKNEYTHR